MTGVGTSRDARARPRRRPVRREWGVALALLLTIVGTGLANPSFLTARNAADMLVHCAPTLIVASGVTLVILVGEIDISVGSLLGLLAAVMGLLSSPQRLGWSPGIAIAATLALGSSIGLISGLLVTLGRVPSIIVSLGMLTVLRGATEMLLGGEWITTLPSGIRWLGTGAVVGVPVSLWTALLVLLVGLWIAHRTPLGLRLHAVGSNPDAARSAGLPVRRLKIFTFALTGFLTGVAALVSVPQLAVIESGLGEGLELLAVTAVVVGGTSIRAGSGTLIGTALAVVLLGIVRTVLLFLELGDSATYWERAIQGAFILGAVLQDHVGSLWRARGLARSRLGSEAGA